MPLRNVPILVLSLGYAAFSLLLYRAGIAPKRVLLLDPSSYYLVQALFILPLFCGLVSLFVGVTSRLAGGKQVPFEVALERLAPAYCWPLLGLFVLPDTAVFLVAGHAALAKAMRFYGPIAPLCVWAISALRAARLFEVSKGRAVAATFVGLLLQALLGGLLLR
jgi:hypothetical protein